MSGEEYISYVKQKPCCICYDFPVDAHHLVAIGMGNNRKKGSDRDFTCIPLCREHHSEFHNSGLNAINHRYNIDLWKEAFMLFKAQFLHSRNTNAIIEDSGEKRTKEQNDYYHGTVCKILGDFFGYEKHEIHVVLKDHFEVGSTSKMTISEFTNYLDRITRWAASEHSVIIPDAARK